MHQNPANLANPEQNAQQNPPQAPPPKKKTKQSFALKPQHLQKPNGLQALYQMTKKLNLDRLEDNVQSSMKQLTVILKTWHFQMLPRYSFDYFVQRCRALGDGKSVQAYMSRVRKIHKGEDQWGLIQPIVNQQANQNVEGNNLNQNEQGEDPQNKNQGVEQKVQRAIKMLSQIQKRDYGNQNNDLNQQNQDDSQDLFALMQQRKRQKAEQKQKMQIQESGQSQEQLYVPQGFENNYQDQSYE